MWTYCFYTELLQDRQNWIARCLFRKIGGEKSDYVIFTHMPNDNEISKKCFEMCIGWNSAEVIR